MQTDAQLAALVRDAYTATPSVQGTDDVRAVFIDFDDELVVAITGTLTVPGWLSDFEFWPDFDPRLGRCHSGFLRNGHMLWALIKSAVLKACAAKKLVTYAGHSLGAAEAQICAAEHVVFGFPTPRVVTFGSPRVALWVNSDFRKILAPVDMTLYKRAGDPVPHVPFSRLLLGLWFCHQRVNTIIGAVLPHYDWDFPLDPINDPNHGIVNYAADLS